MKLYVACTFCNRINVEIFDKTIEISKVIHRERRDKKIICSLQSYLSKITKYFTSSSLRGWKGIWLIRFILFYYIYVISIVTIRSSWLVPKTREMEHLTGDTTSRRRRNFHQCLVCRSIRVNPQNKLTSDSFRFTFIYNRTKFIEDNSDIIQQKFLHENLKSDLSE